MLLIFVFFNNSGSSLSNAASFAEITSMTKISKGGNPSSFRFLPTVRELQVRISNLRVNDVNRLSAPPDRVSLLITSPWMSGSTAVGPQTSRSGTISYSRFGLNEVRKDRTRSLRYANDSRMCLLAFFTSRLSTKDHKRQYEVR